MPCFNFKFSAGNINLCLHVSYKLSGTDLDKLYTGLATHRTQCSLSALLEETEGRQTLTEQTY